MKPFAHSWDHEKVRRIVASESPDGNERTERICRRCPWVKITVTDVFESVATVSSLDPDEIPFAQRKQLFDLHERDCRWPYGDPGHPDFFFCGALTDENQPYCPYHRGMSLAKTINIGRAELERRQRLGRRMAAQNNKGDRRRIVGVEGGPL